MPPRPVGRRGKPVVFAIMARHMENDGHKFYLSDNGVWLTDYVPPDPRYLMLLGEDDQPKTCNDCGAEPGEEHQGCCDVERCPLCRNGNQAMCCDIHAYNEERPDDFNPEWENIREVWTGFWPGELEARAMNWWSRCTPWPGQKYGPYVDCPPDHPDASPDLNRYSSYLHTGKDPGPSKLDAHQQAIMDGEREWH